MASELASLPALREDLSLLPASAQRDGSPAWMIHDPLANRFFRIGWLEFELLSRWHLADPACVLRQTSAETPLRAQADQLGELLRFLRANQLLRIDDADGVARLERLARARRPSAWQWLLHNYLFFRVPLLRPQRLLARVTPWLAWLHSRGFVAASAVAALAGLYLLARQWDVFTHSVAAQFDPAGLLCFAIALLLAKSLHEFSHAIAATRLGVRVAHMGVAFLVMWPMLYTDTSESWKLRDPSARFRIAAAGMLAEFMLAAWATLGWSLADDGPLRDALLFLATTSWVLTLGINASPFMRFDGYFLLSDALDLPNLHARAGELARLRLRRWLLGWQAPDPEAFSAGLRRALVAFAMLTWVYRLVVFVGIAVAVYTFFFKLAGIVLFVVEIAWFIGLPVASELRGWWRERAQARPTRVIFTGLGLIGLIGLMAWPWQRDISGEGWLHAQRQQAIYSPFPARIVQLTKGPQVSADERLVVLDSPEQRAGTRQSEALVQALQTQVDQSAATDAGRERRAALSGQLARERAASRSHQDELSRLALRAPFAGHLLDIDPQLRDGVWVSARQPLAWLIDPSVWVVDAFVGQHDAEQVAIGSRARMIRRAHPMDSLEGTVIAIDTSRTTALPHPMLASEHGGRIASQRLADGSSAPRDALYRVRIQLTTPPTPWRMEAGTVHLSGTRRSLLGEWATAAAALWVRESGF